MLSCILLAFLVVYGIFEQFGSLFYNCFQDLFVNIEYQNGANI